MKQPWTRHQTGLQQEPLYLYPWPEDIRTVIRDIPNTQEPITHFNALHDAFLELQSLSPTLYQLLPTQTTYNTAWQILLNTLLLLERWHLFFSHNLQHWLCDAGTEFHFPGVLVKNTLARLGDFSWELLNNNPTETDTVLEFCIQPGFVLAHPATLELSADWQQTLQYDIETGFQRLYSMWETQLKYDEQSPLTQSDSAPYLQLCYASAINDAESIQTLLQTHTFSTLLPPELIDPPDTQTLPPEHPLYIALLHQQHTAVSLLIKHTPHAQVSTTQFLQLCITHYMLDCLPQAITDNLIDPVLLLLAHPWKFSAVNGVTMALDTPMLMGIWSLLQQDVSFHLSSKTLEDIFTHTLIQLLQTEQWGLFTTLTAMLLWKPLYEQLSATLIWDILDQTSTYFLQKMKIHTTAPMTISAWQQLVNQVPPLPWLFTQLTDSQWSAVLIHVAALAAHADDNTQMPLSALTTLLMHNPIAIQWIERRYRPTTHNQGTQDSWLQNYLQTAPPLLKMAYTPKVPPTPVENNRTIQHFLTFFNLANPQPTVLDTLPRSLYAFDAQPKQTGIPSLCATLETLVLLCDACFKEPLLTIDSQRTALTMLHTLLQHLEVWTSRFLAHPLNSIKPHVITDRHCRHTPDVQQPPIHYPLILCIQIAYTLARLPWDQLPLTLCDEHGTALLEESVQQQLHQDQQTHFSRLITHWRTWVQHTFASGKLAHAPATQRLRLASVMGLTEWVKPICITNPQLIVLPMPRQWGTFYFFLQSSNLNVCLQLQSISQLKEEALMVQDQNALFAFLIGNHLEFNNILFSIGIGWFTPDMLLESTTTDITSLLGFIYPAHTKMLHILALYIQQDPLVRKTRSMHDIICAAIWACATIADYHLSLALLLRDQDFYQFFSALRGEQLGNLLDTLTTTLPEEYKDFDVIRVLCNHFCVEQWDSLLSEDTPSLFATKLRREPHAYQKQYPRMTEALTRFFESADKAAQEAAHKLERELAEEEQRKAQKALEKKVRIQQQEKARLEKIAQKRLQALPSQSAAKRTAPEEKQQQITPHIATPAAAKQINRSPQKKNKATLPAKKSPAPIELAITAPPTNAAAEPENSTPSPLPEMAVSTLSTARAHIAYPAFLHTMRTATPPDWPLLIPGHAEISDTEWHVWLIIPPDYTGNCSLLPTVLWNWPLTPCTATTIYINHLAYPEYRFVPCDSNRGYRINVTITQLSDHPHADITHLLQKHMIGFTATRVNIHQHVWYTPTEKALQDVHTRHIGLLHPECNPWRYSQSMLAFAIKTCAKYYFRQPDHTIDANLRQALHQVLLEKQYAAQLIYLLCCNPTYFARRPVEVWSMVWALQHDTDDLHPIQHSRRYLYHARQGIYAASTLPEHLSFWLLACMMLHPERMANPAQGISTTLNENAELLTALPTPETVSVLPLWMQHHLMWHAQMTKEITQPHTP